MYPTNKQRKYGMNITLAEFNTVPVIVHHFASYLAGAETISPPSHLENWTMATRQRYKLKPGFHSNAIACVACIA